MKWKELFFFLPEMRGVPPFPTFVVPASLASIDISFSIFLVIEPER